MAGRGAASFPSFHLRRWLERFASVVDGAVVWLMAGEGWRRVGESCWQMLFFSAFHGDCYDDFMGVLIVLNAGFRCDCG